MKSEYDFFTIEKEHLKEKTTFPFQLYIFNPIQKKFSMFLNGNRPLTKELDGFLNYLLEKGGQIAILKNQRRTFINAQQLNEEDIPSLKARELHPLEKERIMNIKLKEMYEQKNGAFVFQTEFTKASETDNFEKIIEFARAEILTFSVTQSPTISLGLELVKTHLNKDNYLNRIVAVSYFFAKTINILDPETLADVICGAFLSHLGYTQLPLNILKNPFLSLSDKNKKLFCKHTILSHHLLKKGQLQISEQCKKIVLDHHERVSGEGYPLMKHGDAIDSLSLLVGSIAHLFEYSTGKINGNKIPIRNIMISMKNKTFHPGLEIDFGEKILNSLVTLIDTDKEEKKAA